MTAFLAVTAVVSGFLAVVVPYHLWDALAYGEWSRLITATGDYHFDQFNSLWYHRPLFYVGQAVLWEGFGFSEPTGRLFALLFAFGLLYSIFRLARSGRGGLFAGIVAATLTLASPQVATLAFSGLTDVPVAAFIGLGGVLIWTVPDNRWRRVALAGVCGAALLTKPSALPAVAGLAAAHLVGRRDVWRDSFIPVALPMLVGTALVLPYHLSQASFARESVLTYLRSGTTGYYSELSAQVRWDVILRAEWLGPYLHGLLVFALAYAVLRICTVSHERAVWSAAAGGAAWSLLGPWLALGGGAVSIRAGAVYLLLIVPLAFASRSPPAFVPERLHLARLLVWAAPTFVLWILGAPYDARLLSPAWVPLILLMAVVAMTVIAGALRVHPVAGALVLTGIIGLAALNSRNLDALGPPDADGTHRGWSVVASLLTSDWGDREAARAKADPELGRLLDGVRRHLGPGERLTTQDGRLGFFFPGRVTRALPAECRGAGAYGVMVLLTDPASAQIAGRRAQPGYWTSCRAPRITLVREEPGRWAMLRVAG